MKRKTALEAMGLHSASSNSSNSSICSRSDSNSKRPRVLRDMVDDEDCGAAEEEDDDDVVF